MPIKNATASPASANDVSYLLGELDPIVVERILATGASTEEIGEALRVAEQDRGFGEEPYEASSPRVIEVRAVLEDAAVLDDDFDEQEGS